MTKTEDMFNRVLSNLHTVIAGQDDVLRLILIAFIAKGHVRESPE